MMIKIVLLAFFAVIWAKVDAASYTFSLVPRALDMQGSKKNITLSLVQLPDLELKAIHKNNRTRFIYSRSLKQMMKSLSLTKSDFKPFRSYLKKQIRKAKKDPGTYVNLLGTYLLTGATIDFTVDIEK